MVKPLSFKGDRPAKKKRKRAEASTEDAAVLADSELQDDENWVSADSIPDISGPILLILASSQPVSCLSVDSLGKVFAQPIENLIENEPFTAEPHDVRQVWIANRVVGMEKDFTFKGHHGRYLGCSNIGELTANREAVSSEETFKVEESDDRDHGRRTFVLRSGRNRYLSAHDKEGSIELRGDSEEIGEENKIYIRMQARFKPQHKVGKAEKSAAKISRKEIESEVGRRLEDDEVKRLKKARKEGNYHEAMLDVKVKGKHDKFA